jgi:hypothetical protein
MAIIQDYTINEILENTFQDIQSLEIHLGPEVEIGVILSDDTTIVVYGDNLQDATGELAAILL